MSLTRRPDRYFSVVRKIAKEWRKIDERNLRRAIKRLYQSKLINYRENKDGVITLIITDKGKSRILKYNLRKIEIRKPSRWDGLWRMVLFDIPEKKKQGRDALTAKFKELGFYPLQKSVFIYPYECKDEIDFIVEIFGLVPYVRFLRVKDIDVHIDLINRFSLR